MCVCEREGGRERERERESMQNQFKRMVKPEFVLLGKSLEREREM